MKSQIISKGSPIKKMSTNASSAHSQTSTSSKYVAVALTPEEGSVFDIMCVVCNKDATLNDTVRYISYIYYM
jgi:hypothetical protein